MLKLINKFKEIVLGKYYDESSISHLKDFKFSNVFPVDMIVLEG